MKSLYLLVIVALVILPSILLSQNVGIGEPSPSEKLDVNGRIVAKGYKNTILNAEGSSSFSLSPGGSWVDAPNLEITFTLQEPTTVVSSYSMSLFNSNNTLIPAYTRLLIDGASFAPSMNSCAFREYHTYTNQHTAELAAGTHTIKVQCRNDGSNTLFNSPNSIQERRLQVLIFGHM